MNISIKNVMLAITAAACFTVYSVITHMSISIQNYNISYILSGIFLAAGILSTIGILIEYSENHLQHSNETVLRNIDELVKHLAATTKVLPVNIPEISKKETIYIKNISVPIETINEFSEGNITLKLIRTSIDNLYTTVILEAGKNSRILNHSYDQHFRGFVISGKMKHSIDGLSTEYSEGDSFSVPASSIHGFNFLDDTTLLCTYKPALETVVENK